MTAVGNKLNVSPAQHNENHRGITDVAKEHADKPDILATSSGQQTTARRGIAKLTKEYVNKPVLKGKIQTLATSATETAYTRAFFSLLLLDTKPKETISGAGKRFGATPPRFPCMKPEE